MNRSTLRTCLVLVLLTVAVFSDSLKNEFVNWDDPMFISENPKIQCLDADHIKTIFTTTEAGAYTPLSQLSLALDYALWGNNPVGFHLMALLLHAGNACLVFGAARFLIRASLGGSGPPSDLGAWVGALLFALHPMRVESVAWACERRDVLSGFFGLACALAYLRYVQTLSLKRRPPWYLITFLLFLCALISKAVVVGLPLVFLLLDIHPLRRVQSAEASRKWRALGKIVIEKLPMLAAALGLGIVTLKILISQGKALGPGAIEFGPRLAQSLAANALYLEKIFLPLPLNPLDRTYQIYDFSQSIVWRGLVVNGAITLLFGILARRHPSGLIAWISYLIIIAPFLGLSQSGLQLTADRYTYLAVVPLCIWLGGAFQQLWNARWEQFPERFRRWTHPILAAFALLILASLGYRAYFQTRIWSDSETLWTHSLNLDSQNSVALNNLGVLYAEQKLHAKSIVHYQDAIRFWPSYTDAWFNLGNSSYILGRYPEAREAYRRVLELEPSHRGALNNLAGVFVKMENLPWALHYYEQAMRWKASPETEYNIGRCRELQGDVPEAIRHYQIAARGGYPEGWVQWSFLVRNKNQSRALEILELGMRHLDDPRLRAAYVETLLACDKIDPVSLETCGKMLAQLEQRTQGQSEKVRLLKDLFQKRSSPKK